MSNSKPIFGIDLGTTYSSIGVYNPENHTVEIARLPSESSNMLLPSAVYVESPTSVIVGSAAINAGMSKPERLFRWFKRDLGTSASDREIDGQLWTPVELSAEILKTLKQEAETAFVTEVKDVIITFPAFFTPQQKDLTADAARLAGLNVVRMCEEPHAAAIAFVIEEVLRQAKESGQKVDDLSHLLVPLIEQLAGGQKAVLVYDLGGGTFDVAMIQASGVATPSGLTELQFKTICNDGDISKGGKDWDSAIMQLICDKDEELNNHNPFNDPVLTRFDEEVEKAKKTLARLTSTKVICPSFHQIEITRDEANQRTQHLLDTTRHITETIISQAVQDQGIEKDGITLLLCGGMSNWPAVPTMLTQVMDNKEPRVHKTLDLLVTMGAAYLAYLSGVSLPRGPRIIDPGTGEPVPVEEQEPIPPSIGNLTITSTGITPGKASTPAVGIEVVDHSDPIFATDPGRARKIVQWVIPSEPEVGNVYRETFNTVEDNQTRVDIVLYFLKEREGHKHDESDLNAWHRYTNFIMTFPPKPKGDPIHVQMQYTEAGTISGKAVDDTGAEIDIEGKTFKS